MDDEEFEEYKKNPIALGCQNDEEDADDIDENDPQEMVDVYTILLNILDEKIRKYPSTLKNDVIRWKEVLEQEVYI